MGVLKRTLQPRKRTSKAPLPGTPEAWLREIAAAWLDAHATIPFGPLAGVAIAPDDLFHLGPSVCLKFRGLKPSRTALHRATQAALVSLVATRDREPQLFSNARFGFAFTYLAAHFGLGLLSEAEASGVRDYVASHMKKLDALIARSLGRP